MVKIPNRLEDLYPANALEMLTDVLHQPGISAKVREALDRVGLRELNPLEQVQQAWQQARSWIESVASDSDATQETHVINASGQLFHPQIASLPTNMAVARVLASACSKSQHAERLRARQERISGNILGGASTCWTTSLFDALDGLIGPRQVLIAKTDLVRIPHVGDVASMLGHKSIIEIGPSNGCSADDWHAALTRTSVSPQSELCILTVSPNALPHEEALRQRKETFQVAAEKGIPVFGLLADGVFNAKLNQQFGFPLITEMLKNELDVAVAPLSLLVGGVSGGLLMGKQRHVTNAALSARSRGTELPAPLLSASLLALQLSILTDDLESGALGNLMTNPANLAERARRIAVQLNQQGSIQTAVEQERSVAIGPAPWSRYSLTNWAVKLESMEPASLIREKLAAGSVTQDGLYIPPVLTEGSEHTIWVDLRFVDPKDDHLIVAALSPGARASVKALDATETPGSNSQHAETAEPGPQSDQAADS